MALRKDTGDLGWTKEDDKKKKLKPKTGRPKKPGLSGDEIAKQVKQQAQRVQKQRQAMAPPKKPGKVSSLDPFYKIIEADGKLDLDDIRYLQKLAWTTKNADTPEDLKAFIDDARKFFEENPDLKRVAGIQYNAFHTQGKVVDTKWYKAMMAAIDADKAAGEGQQYLKDNAAKMRLIPEGTSLDRTTDDPIAPAIAPEFSAADLTPETANAIIHALVDTSQGAGLTQAESEKLFSPENVVKIENVTDFDGQGPGFIVHYADGINKSKQAILWSQVPKRLKPGGQIEAGASVATGSTLPTDQHLDMLNNVWRDVFKDTKAARGIPEDVLPALLTSGLELQNKGAARKAFEALRDPYLTDPRNPYAENPEVYFQFLAKQQDILTDNTNETIGDPYDAASIAAQNDPTALQGVLTPFEDEGFTDISGQVYWGETHPDMIRLDGLIVAAAKEYEGLPKIMQKAGQVLSRANLHLPAGDHAMTMMDIIEEWTGVKSPDGSFTLEQEEAIREKQYLSALMRSLANPKDDEADYYLANEYGLPMVEGSVAKAYFDQYIPERIVYTPEEIAGMTAEERELAQAEVAKTREERYAELATRLAIESKLPFESDASAVYKLYKINPELVMPEYKQIFNIALESVEKEYGVIFNERGGIRPQVQLDRHNPPTGPPKIAVRLTPEQTESIVYTAINMAEVNLYAEAEPELPPEKRTAGKVGIVEGERQVETQGSFLSAVEQAWNALFHHPIATVLEQSQLAEGQRLAETGRFSASVMRTGRANTERMQQRKNELVAQYTEYITAQRLAHPEMDDEDFKSTWSSLSWTWNDLKRRGGGYINMGTYFLQEGDPNYQKGDNLLAEFLIDSVYEFAFFAPVGSGFKQAKNAAKLSDAWRAKRAAWHTHLGQSTVGDFAVKCTNAFTFMDRWGLDAQTSVRLAGAKDLKAVNAIYDGLRPLQKLKFDIGQWDMPLRAKLAFKAKLVQHPALDRFISITGTHTIGGGNFPLDHRAARNAFERAYAGGLSYEDAQAVAEIFTRIWAREISGEDALRAIQGFADIYPETVLRSMHRTLMSRKGALDAAAGKIPKGLEKRVALLTDLNDELVRMSHAAQRMVDEIEVAKKAAGAAPNETAVRHIGELERNLEHMNRRIRKLSSKRDKVRGAGSFRPAPEKRPMSDMERKMGQYAATTGERLDMQHNMKVLFDDLEDLIRERNKRIPANDKWRIDRFHKEYPGTSGEYWDEMVRTASYQALDPEGNFVPEMLTKEFVEENGFISEDRLAQWWRDKVRPVTKREAEAIKGREPGQIYAPKQGGEAPVETSKTTGPHEAMELVRARQRAAREQRKLRRELRRIAPRIDEDMEKYTQTLIEKAGLREQEAYVEAQRMILRDLAQRADIDPSSIRDFNVGTRKAFINLAHQAEVGDDITEMWKAHWHTLVDELDAEPGAFVKEGPGVTYKTPKTVSVDLAELQRVVRSKRRRADLAEQMYYYGRQSSVSLRAERDTLRGVGWQTVAEDLGLKVTIKPRSKWPPSVRKDSVGMTIVRGGKVKDILVDRLAIHRAFEENAWPEGMAARGSRKLPREIAKTKEGLEDYVVAHELAHATGVRAEEVADRIASRISRRREVVDAPPAPWKTPETIDDYMDPLIVETSPTGEKVWAHPQEAMLDIDMPPEQYLAESRTTYLLGVDEGDYVGDVTAKYGDLGQDAAIRTRLETGQVVDPVVIDGYLAPDGMVRVTAGSLQQGDHRALVAMEIGHENIPVKVRVFVQEGASRRPATAEELVNARFHAIADPDDFPDLRVRPRGIDNEMRTRQLTVIDKILAQRAAESEAIGNLRKEIGELQKIIDQAQSATPEQIAAGRVPAAAMGNYAESPQPLIPAQLQATYQPPVDPRLEMIWRSGKGARLLEEFNTHPKSFFGITSMDRATNIFKVAILARVATAIRIVLADEFTRLLPEGINPIQARIYLKEMLEYEARTGRRVLPGELRAELKQIYGVVRKSSYMPLDPGDPDFIAAYTGMLQQWAGDPVVQLWKNAYMAEGGGEAGIQAAKDALRVAANTPNSVVAAHLRLSNRWWPANLSMEDVYGAMGAKGQMGHLRKAFESKNVDDWVDVASEQFSFFALNKWTSKHFLEGVKPKSRHFKGAKGTFGKGFDAPPIVVGRMNFGDIQEHWWLPQVAFGRVLESASGHLTEIAWTHFYVEQRTALLHGLASDLPAKLTQGVDVGDIWQAHKWLDEDTLTQVEALSAQYAEQITTKIMYTAGTAGAEDVLRNIILFLPAQRQYIAYWAKAIMQNPVLLAYFHRLNAMPDYLEFHAPWNREGEMSKLYLRGLLFATPGFQEDSLQSKAYQMMPGLGMPGIILGSAVGVADMAGFSQPKELAMKLPQGDYYKDTWRPLNSSLTQLSYGLSTIILGKPYNLLPEQVVGDNTSNLWKFAEAMKAQVSRVLKGDGKGRVDMTQMPDLEGGANWNAARTHGLQALLSAGWNFLVPIKYSIVDEDAQAYMDLQVEWNTLETYGQRMDFIAKNRTSNFVKVLQLEIADSEEDRQRLLYNNPELMPYYVSNVGFIAPEGEEYDFGNVVQESKKLFMSKMDTERSLQLRKELDAETAWFENVYMPALRRREPWTGGNINLTGASAAYTPDSPSNLIRVRKDWENSTGAFGAGSITDKDGNVHLGIGKLREEIGSGAYLSKSDFASDPDSAIYKATEQLFESRAGARFVRTSRHYGDFVDLYRISHKEGEEEAILAAMQPFTQMSELERASVFGKKWTADEEWILQRVASVWDQYEEGYKAWLKKTDKNGKHPNAGKDHGDFRYTDHGEALYAAVTNEVWKHLAGPKSSPVLAGGMAQQLLYTPLVRPHFVIYEDPEKNRQPSDPINSIERLLDQQTGMGDQPGIHGGPLSDIPQTLPKWDESGTRKVKYGEKALPERLVPGVMASVALAARIKTTKDGQMYLVWSKADLKRLESEAEYLKTYMKTADPVTKYNIREAQRAFTWTLFLRSMAATTQQAWGVRSEYQQWNSGYRGRNSSETMTKKYIKKLEKQFLPAFFEASPLFKKEWEYYNEKAGGNLIADMINTYR